MTPLRGLSDNKRLQAYLHVPSILEINTFPPPTALKDHSPLLPEDQEDQASQPGQGRPAAQRTEEE